MWKDPLQADKEPLLPQKEKIMAKKVVGKIKLQIEAGKANPSPPVGPALGQHGVNIMDFCKQFNAKTQLDISSQLLLMFTKTEVSHLLSNHHQLLC